MFQRKKTMLYFCPHQDDELITMGIDIGSHVRKKDCVHVILCTDGSQSAVRKTLSNGRCCSFHEGAHTYNLSTEEFVQARDREFMGSCAALGVNGSHVHIPENRSMDGSLTVKDAEAMIAHFVSMYGPNVVVCTVSPNNGPSQHRDHKALGKAAENLLHRGIVREARFFIEPYLFAQIQDNPRLIPVDPTITKAGIHVEKAVRQAAASYSCWNPDTQRYAIGYHSVPAEFDAFLKNRKAYSFEKSNPESMTVMQKLRQQHKKWRKLHKQKQFFYSATDCAQPNLGAFRLIHISAHDTGAYQDYCEKFHVQLTDKNLQRVADGSSFWCLVSDSGIPVSSGWLAYKQHFYIGETDFGFDMRQSETAILFDFNTKAEYRGNGYYGLLLRSIIHHSEGPGRYIIYTSPDNTASSNGILKAGFHFDGVNSACDNSMKRYLRKEGFTSITRKNRLWGLRVLQS